MFTNIRPDFHNYCTHKNQTVGGQRYYLKWHCLVYACSGTEVNEKFYFEHHTVSMLNFPATYAWTVHLVIYTKTCFKQYV